MVARLVDVVLPSGTLQTKGENRNMVVWTTTNFCCAVFLLLAALFAAKIVIIVVGIVSALVVMVLSAVYTKRAIDRRLAHVHVHEEVQVEEQHLLLGSRQASTSSGVVVSVETPVVVAAGSSGARHLGHRTADDVDGAADSGSTMFRWWSKLLGGAFSGDNATSAANRTAEYSRHGASDAAAEEGNQHHQPVGGRLEHLLGINGATNAASSVGCRTSCAVPIDPSCNAAVVPNGSPAGDVTGSSLTRGAVGHPSEQQEGGVQRRHSKPDLRSLHLC